MKIKALVSVRSGSLRVQNKNMRPFAGKSLLEIKIAQLLKVSNLDGIVINSNDDAMLAIGKKMGCEIVKREQQFATNDAPMSEVYRHMAEHIDSDVIAAITVTNPLMTAETIFQTIELYKKLTQITPFDSVNTVNSVKEFLFRDNQPINYQLENQPRSQDLPDIYSLNFACNVIKKEDMIQYKNVVGRKPYLHVVDEIEGLDIDTMVDFECAEFLYKKKYGL